MTASEEEWLPVVGFEGCYSVSSLGRVRGERRSVPGKLGSIRVLPQRVLSCTPDDRGYIQVSLKNGGPRRSFKVARLVAEAFLGPRPLGLQICHGPGGHQNNAVGNLRYDTAEANVQDRIDAGGYPCGEGSPGAKLTAEQVSAIRKDGRSCRAIGRSFSVSHATISAIKREVTWK